MTAPDLFAGAASAAASLAMALRSIMLKPEMPSWCDAPPFVRLAIVFAAAVWAGVALDIFRIGHVSSREAMAFGAVAILAGALLADLWRQNARASDVHGHG